MSKKLFYILVVILLACIALVSWKLMLFIAVIVGIAVFVFGKKNVQDFISGNYKKAKTKLAKAYDRLVTEDPRVVTNVSSAPAEQQGFYKVLILTEDGNEYSTLIPKGDPIPASIKIGAKIIIAKGIALSEDDGITKKYYIIIGDEKYECV